MAFNMSVIDQILKEVYKENVSSKSDTCVGDVQNRLPLNADLTRCLHLCSLDFDVEFQIPFDQRKIALHVYSKIATLGKEVVMTDICHMIGYHVQGGYNLEYMIEKAVQPEYASTLKRLIKTYNLVTKSTNAESVTLYRVCAAFPDLTCEYLTNVVL